MPNCFDKIVEKKIRELDVDIIHTHHPMIIGNTAIRLGKKLGIPVVFTYHTKYEEYLHYLVNSKSKQTYAREFQMQIFSQTALGYMMSIIVGLIGIMNYINTAASSIISRRHEFVILHSIGMTKRQLKNMLLLENIYIVSLVSIFSIMLSSVLGRTFVKSIIETSWCSSYRFAVWPLFAVLLLYFGISIIMPLLLIKNQEGESIVFRMKQLTDSY